MTGLIFTLLFRICAIGLLFAAFPESPETAWLLLIAYLAGTVVVRTWDDDE